MRADEKIRRKEYERKGEREKERMKREGVEDERWTKIETNIQVVICE